MPDPSNPYRLTHFPRVREQLLNLAGKAKRLGIGDAYTAALRYVLSRLRTDPLEWGDPERHTKHEGGTVFHGVHSPLVVRYVVYEPEHVVCLLEFHPFPSTSLADDE